MTRVLVSCLIFASIREQKLLNYKAETFERLLIVSYDLWQTSDGWLDPTAGDKRRETNLPATLSIHGLVGLHRHMASCHLLRRVGEFSGMFQLNTFQVCVFMFVCVRACVRAYMLVCR